MKKILVLFVFSLSTLFISAQSYTKNVTVKTTVETTTETIRTQTEDVGKIALHVLMPDAGDPAFGGLSRGDITKLRSKITQITTRNGIGGGGFGSFVIYPMFDIYMEEELNSGVDKQINIMGEFSLYVAQMSTGEIFGSTSVEVEGYGRTRDRAIKKAIQMIKVRNSIFDNLINESKEKIVAYYLAKCDDIMVEAEGYSKTRNYDDAIATLMQVPTEVGECYQEVVGKSVEYYNYKMELECEEKIAAAKVAKAQDDWETAAGYMYGILPHFLCYDNAMTLLQEIEDHRCAVSLGKAKAAWARGENGANEAAMHLGQIASDSKCAEEANALSAEVRGRLQDLELREWELQYEKYNREQRMREDVVYHALDVSDRKMAMKERDQQHRQDMAASDQQHSQYMDRDKSERADKLAHREMDYKEGRGADLEEAKINRQADIEEARINSIKEIAVERWKYKAEKAKADGNKTINYNYYSKKKKKK